MCASLVSLTTSCLSVAIESRFGIERLLDSIRANDAEFEESDDEEDVQRLRLGPAKRARLDAEESTLRQKVPQNGELANGNLNEQEQLRSDARNSSLATNPADHETESSEARKGHGESSSAGVSTEPA